MNYLSLPKQIIYQKSVKASKNVSNQVNSKKNILTNNRKVPEQQKKSKINVIRDRGNL